MATWARPCPSLATARPGQGPEAPLASPQGAARASAKETKLVGSAHSSSGTSTWVSAKTRAKTAREPVESPERGEPVGGLDPRRAERFGRSGALHAAAEGRGRQAAGRGARVVDGEDGQELAATRSARRVREVRLLSPAALQRVRGALAAALRHAPPEAASGSRRVTVHTLSHASVGPRKGQRSLGSWTVVARPAGDRSLLGARRLREAT